MRRRFHLQDVVNGPSLETLQLHVAAHAYAISGCRSTGLTRFAVRDEAQRSDLEGSAR